MCIESWIMPGLCYSIPFLKSCMFAFHINMTNYSVAFLHLPHLILQKSADNVRNCICLFAFGTKTRSNLSRFHIGVSIHCTRIFTSCFLFHVTFPKRWSRMKHAIKVTVLRSSFVHLHCWRLNKFKKLWNPHLHLISTSISGDPGDAVVRNTNDRIRIAL